MRRPCSTSRALDGRVNRYYDPVTGEFTTIDPLAGGTSNPPATGPGTGSGSQPVSIYQSVLGALAGIQFNSGDPAAGLPSNSGDTTGAVGYPDAFGRSDIALDALSSMNGLPMTSPAPLNPTYVGAGFFTPDSVSSSGSPYAYSGGDPLNGVDPDGENFISQAEYLYHLYKNGGVGEAIKLEGIGQQLKGILQWARITHNARLAEDAGKDLTEVDKGEIPGEGALGALSEDAGAADGLGGVIGDIGQCLEDGCADGW